MGHKAKPLHISVQVCALGSLRIDVGGDQTLAKHYRGEIVRALDETLERAALAAERHEHLDERIQQP